MNAFLKRLAGGILALAISLAVSQAQAVSLSLDPPSGALNGAPGETVGWGFTLTNDSNYYLVVTGADFLHQSPTLGSFTDLVGPQYLVLEPDNTLTQAFDASMQQGIGQFVLNLDAPVNSLISGQISLSYDLFSTDPTLDNFDSIRDTISTGNTVAAPASVAVPEPATALLMVAGVPVFTALRRRGQPCPTTAATID